MLEDKLIARCCDDEMTSDCIIYSDGSKTNIAEVCHK